MVNVRALTPQHTGEFMPLSIKSGEKKEGDALIASEKIS